VVLNNIYGDGIMRVYEDFMKQLENLFETFEEEVKDKAERGLLAE